MLSSLWESAWSRALGLVAAPAEYLLPVGVAGGVSVLPSSTQLFAASARYGRAWHAVAAGTAALGALLLLIGAGQPAGSGAGAALVALGVLVPLCGAGACALLARRVEAAHALEVQRGQCQQGVLVFPNGDVVVRFQGVFADVETTIEASHLSRAEVERVCAPSRLTPQPCLVLYHVGADGKTRALRVSQLDLLDKVERVADALNEGHSRAMLHGGGGF